MKLKNKVRLLNELARGSENPKEFIYHCMALQNQHADDLADAANMTRAHFYVVMAQIASGGSISVGMIVKLSKGLDIDPAILNKVVAEYNLNKYLNGIFKNN